MFAYVPVTILGPGAIAMKKQTKLLFFFLQNSSLRVFYIGEQEEAVEK